MSTLVQPTVEKVEPQRLPQAGSALLVLFGATGDLSRRKLIPALYDLACVGCTNRNFDVLGIGRTKLSDEEFRQRMHDGAANSKDSRNFTEEGWKDFASRLHYFIGDADKPEFYPAAEGEDRGDAEERRQQEHAVLRLDFSIAGAAHCRRSGRSGTGSAMTRAGRASFWKSRSDAICKARRS